MKKTRSLDSRSKFVPPHAPPERNAPSSVSNGQSVGNRGIAVPRPDAERSALHDSSLRRSGVNPAVLEELYDALHQVTAAANPRSFKLLQAGRRKVTRKLIEEACEVAVEALKHSADGVVRESADLLYHLVVLWFSAGIEPAEVWREMQLRASTLGIAEKLPKTSNAKTSATVS